ncbi:MAG: thioredoxin domain-containing protein, partial [Phycisphaerae bacterium]|nr:thioredoxin domain-containing protein [Gammaproteobacteria bacterium]NIU99827.1 thioredoxin domain-containing protein [Phycisphaerae bacterium]NIV68851.1 thioredoxin domain-containing protein [Phycisphaerae bacterium]
SLFDARSQRVRPHLDDKVIAAWNGMAMSAFARAGKALDDEAYVARASDVANFILQHMCEGHARLFRCSRQDSAAIKAFSEDYAFVIRGLLDLYACDFDIKWLKSSILLADSLREFF